ncbi:MAG TPA: signal peptidase I [Methylomirabilota bacterium]
MDSSDRIVRALVGVGALALVVALPVAVRSRFEGVWIPSASMAPTLLAGDYVLMDKSAHWAARGDLVVFTDPAEADQLLVKRVVGVGGEEIVVDGHDVYVNCEPGRASCRPLAEPYADWSAEPRAPGNAGPVQIPSDAVFVMADNRNAGEDSRHWGPLARDRIVGRPVWVYWSTDADGHLRWDRVGRRLR